MRFSFNNILGILLILVPVCLLGMDNQSSKNNHSEKNKQSGKNKELSQQSAQPTQPIKKPVVLPVSKSGIPTEINFQGRMGNVSDTTRISGTINVLFKLFDAPTGGTILWSEMQDSVKVDKGVFNVLLGSVTPITASIFTGAPIWLEIQVGSQVFAPRKKLVSVGYAIKSLNSDTANYISGANVIGKVANAIHSDTANYAIRMGAVDSTRISANTYRLEGKDTTAFARSGHNHIGEIWNTNTGNYGLVKKISVSSSSNVFCEVDSAINTGTGDASGGYFYGLGSGTGDKYGIYGDAEVPSGSNANAYGTSGTANHSGTGAACGGYFYGLGNGTGYKYGVYGEADAPAGSINPAFGSYQLSYHSGTGPAFGSYGYANHSGTGEAYGGKFYGKGTGTGDKYGIYGEADAPAGSTNSAYGTSGYANHSGAGDAYGGKFNGGGSGTGTKYGIYGEANGPANSINPAYGVSGYANHSGTGAAYGGKFYAGGTGTGTKYGIYATASDSGTKYAGYFAGDVVITGSSNEGNGSLLIDHPLDPKNKLLRHNFVESPENLCVYRGKVKLDSDGKGMIKMPDYFIALTKADEATVNLTPIGEKWTRVVSYEWNTDYSGFFVYGEPDREVACTVYANRNDPVIQKLRKPVEEQKSENTGCKAGELLYPEAYGYPKEMGRDYKTQQEMKAAQ